jgi:hypothetical protein
VGLEKRTRVEVFLPVRTDTTDYRAISEWLSEELALARGGSTLTTPFTGLYVSSVTRGSVLRDQIQILSCDFDLDIDDKVHRTKLLSYLYDVRRMLMEVLDEEDVWITYHAVTRIS